MQETTSNLSKVFKVIDIINLITFARIAKKMPAAQNERHLQMKYELGQFTFIQKAALEIT